MKARDSSMPEEAYWATFFNADAVLEKLGAHGRTAGGVLEFGCGYGAFAPPVARRTDGIMAALDMDPAMVAQVTE